MVLTSAPLLPSGRNRKSTRKAKPSAVTSPIALPTSIHSLVKNSRATGDPWATSSCYHGVTTVLDLSTEWCAPCRAIAPIVKELAGTYEGKVKIVKMNIDENPEAPGRYGVRAIPTLLAFQGGQVVEQMQGARPKAALEEMVQKLL